MCLQDRHFFDHNPKVGWAVVTKTSALKTAHMAGFWLIQNEGESCVHVVIQLSTRNDPVQSKASQDDITGNFLQV